MIIVFDIGKTNKKVFVFDEDYNIVHERSTHLLETTDEDGDVCEDIHELTRWILDSFNDIVSRPGLNIKAINFSTYGASFVHLGIDGKPVAPLYNYLKPFPEDLKTSFYNAFGGEKAFAKATASPVLGNLNSGMILYFLKHRKPDIFRRISTSLHLPQYVASLFNKNFKSDLTSIGCHTNLWDFQANRYHEWVANEEIDRKLAPIAKSDTVFEFEAVHNIMYSGIGLHDSSSALIPYLAHTAEPFVLLSTGTWCITLNPFNDIPLTSAELEQDCLCYLTYEGKPVKASRLFSGHFHEEKVREIAGVFGVPEDAYKTVGWVDLDDDSKPPFERAYNGLVRDLVKQQVNAINLVLTPGIKTIYVDGGFCQNKIFMRLLAEAYPNIKVYAASVTQASALGAAMVIHNHWNNKPMKRDLLHLNLYSPAS